MKQILLNADVGEGMRNDSALMPYLDYANIACGGHFGNQKTISETIALAKNYQVEVGAHPSYPDPSNFGRKSMCISKNDLFQELSQQIDAFLAQCNKQNVIMSHIKLHGALYNDVFNSKEYTQRFMSWVISKYPNTHIFVPIAALVNLTEHQNEWSLTEVFGDRNYTEALTLVPRSSPNAIIGSLKKIETHISSIVDGFLITTSGIKREVKADTLCIHGDHPLALEIAAKINLSINES